MHPTFLLVIAALATSPSLLAQLPNQVITAGYTDSIPAPLVVAPGQVITLFVRGISVPDAVATQVPLPTPWAAPRSQLSRPWPNWNATLSESGPPPASNMLGSMARDPENPSAAREPYSLVIRCSNCTAKVSPDGKSLGGWASARGRYAES